MVDQSDANREAEPSTLPPHIQETVTAIAQLQAQHDARATPWQRIIEKAIAKAGRPAFLSWLAILGLGWVALNLVLMLIGRPPIDPPPFFWMQGAVSLTALCMTVLILTTQRRENELTSLREELTLELVILTEQKAAKIIALVEELRRDDPHISDRHDSDAAALSAPADPNVVVEALKDQKPEPGVDKGSSNR